MSEENINSSEQPAKSRKLTDKKKKKIRSIRIYDVILILLIGVVLYSGYQVVSKLIEYRKADKHYSELENEVVKVVDGPKFYPISTQPEDSSPDPAGIRPDSSAESSEQGSREDPSAAPTGPSRPVISGTEESIPELPTRPAKTHESFAAPKGSMPWLDVNFPALLEKNKDVVGWLYGQDGEINLPVVQGSNNNYYLHRLLDGTWNFAGTLFVDYRNHFLTDDLTVIYGHKMRNKTMFGKLDLYDSYDYYLEHPVMRLYTPTAIYELQIVASVYTDIWEEIIFNYASEADFMAKVQSFRNRARYATDVEVEYGDKLVCLYTCAYQVSDGRLFMICKLVQIA